MESHEDLMESHKEVLEHHEDVMENLLTVRPQLLGPHSTAWPCPGKQGSQNTRDQTSSVGMLLHRHSCPTLRITMGWCQPRRGHLSPGVHVHLLQLASVRAKEPNTGLVPTVPPWEHRHRPGRHLAVAR